MIDLELTATTIEIESHTTAEIKFTADNVDEPDILKQIEIGEVITYYSPDDLLDYIGRDAAIEYWKIIEVEEAE